MKPIKLDYLPLVKIENRKSLYHRNIVDQSVGAKNVIFHYAKMKEGGYGYDRVFCDL